MKILVTMGLTLVLAAGCGKKSGDKTPDKSGGAERCDAAVRHRTQLDPDFAGQPADGVEEFNVAQTAKCKQFVADGRITGAQLDCVIAATTYEAAKACVEM